MSDITIFFIGCGVMLMVVIGTFLFTFNEFKRMGENPDNYKK